MLLSGAAHDELAVAYHGPQVLHVDVCTNSPPHRRRQAGQPELLIDGSDRFGLKVVRLTAVMCEAPTPERSPSVTLRNNCLKDFED
jgi:hypothetical protein